MKAKSASSRRPDPRRPAVRRRPAAGVVPCEDESLFLPQQRSYADCYVWRMAAAERRAWTERASPALGTLRVFSCGLFVEAHGHEWERTGLNEGVLIYCTEGKGFFRQDDREWTVQAGDLIYCPPLTHHRYWADAQQPWTIYWMHLSGELLSHYEDLLGLVARGPVRHIGFHGNIVADFARLATHPVRTSASDEELFCIQANAVAILGRLGALPHNIAEIAAAYGPIHKAMAVMKESLGQAFDLPRFAATAGCGIFHFSRQFRRVTGLPPGEWFIRQKMQRARELLTLPNILVKGVANRLGYTDPLYFSRIFKRIVGLPPEAYRRKMARMHGLDDHPDSGANG